MIEHINSGNEAAGIINQGNDIDPVFFAIRICKAGTDAAVPAPDFIDMGAFIAAPCSGSAEVLTEAGSQNG